MKTIQRAKPVSEATRALLTEMQQDAKPSEDKLDKVRAEISKLRSLEFEATSLRERQSEIAESVQQITWRTLVDLFDDAGINKLGIDADGNLPPYEVELGEHYKASIPEEKADAAFAHLTKTGHADLIKTTFTIAFGLKESKAAERFARSLDKAGVPYSAKRGVPWNTLTAWFRVEHKKKPLPAKVMELLGATVGRVAKVVKQKEKK